MAVRTRSARSYANRAKDRFSRSGAMASFGRAPSFGRMATIGRKKKQRKQSRES